MVMKMARLRWTGHVVGMGNVVVDGDIPWDHAKRMAPATMDRWRRCLARTVLELRISAPR